MRLLMFLSLSVIASCATSKKSYTFEQLNEVVQDRFLDCSMELEEKEFVTVRHVLDRLNGNQEAIRDTIEWYIASCTLAKTMNQLDKDK